MNELDRADVDAAGRLTDQQQRGLFLDLARNDDLLLVAAREVAGGQVWVRRTHVEILHQPGGAGPDRGVVHQRAGLVFRVAVMTEDGVFPGGEIHDQPLDLPVLGDVADARAPPRRGVRPGQRQRRPVQADRAGDLGAGVGITAQDLHQLGLAVAADPGDAQDLARAHGQVDAAQPFHPGPVHHPQAGDFQHRGAGPGRRLVHAQQHLAPHHQLGQLLGRGPGGAQRCHHFAPPHDRHVVGDLHDLAQLVGDDDDRLALFAQPAQDAEQVVGLGRGQHAGRLVQDQDVGLAVQRLEDLDPLLVADRQGFHPRVGVHLQLIFRRQPPQLVAGAAQRGAQQHPVLGPQDDVFQDRHVGHQLEVLEHHADPGADRRLAVGDAGVAPADQDVARVGPVKAVEDRHQRRLAGAVFADDAVDRAARHGHGDVAIGLHRAEGLGNPAQLDRRRGAGGGVGPPRGGRVQRHHSTGQVLSVM